MNSDRGIRSDMDAFFARHFANALKTRGSTEVELIKEDEKE